MQKLPGVASVRVSLNEGLTVLDLKPANTVALSQLRQVIRNNGFVTKEAQVTARGTVTTVANGLMFEVTGSSEKLTLSFRPDLPSPFEELRTRAKATASAEVVISGTVDLSDPKALRMTVAAVH
jgi:hypothetical protein